MAFVKTTSNIVHRVNIFNKTFKMGKKKGAGNKLAKMSEEERLRYLQHRAEIEEEARRRKQQLISIFMKVNYTWWKATL